MWSSVVIPKSNDRKEVRPDPEASNRSTLAVSKPSKLSKKEDRPESEAVLRPSSASKPLKFFRKEERTESEAVIRPQSAPKTEVLTKKGIPNKGNTCYMYLPSDSVTL